MSEVPVMPDATSLVSQIIEGLDSGAMVTRFVVVAEVMDSDGKRGVWVEHGDTCMAWDYLGLLTYAINEPYADVDDDTY